MNSHRVEAQNIIDPSQNADWRVLAKQATEQEDSAKLMELIEALTNALDRELMAAISYAR